MHVELCRKQSIFVNFLNNIYNITIVLLCYSLKYLSTFFRNLFHYQINMLIVSATFL